MWEVAGRPKFQWFGRFSRMEWVRDHIADAGREGAVPLIAVMRHQGNACGGDYAGGGPTEDEQTREWYRAFAQTGRIAPRRDRLRARLARDHRLPRATLAPEPPRPAALRRRRPLGSSERTVYLEAGASDWEPARRTAKQLRCIGIRKVRGFMLNLTHYDWTRANVRHGLRISRRVGGKPFIVNTAANGRGPVHWRNARRRLMNVWCHSLKRGLGIPPTTATGHPLVHAFLWIGRPGYSGGSCNGGPLPVGAWWPARALMLAKYSTTWLSRPRGTRFGLFRRYSLREVAGDGYL